MVVWVCPACGTVRYGGNQDEDLSGEECENCGK
jgi:DNA-directed RNA polymerase subunit RPC12/RpoP